MLLSWLLRQVLMWGGVAIALTAIVVIRNRIRASSSLPAAGVVGTKAAVRRALIRWWPALALVVGLVLLYWSYGHKIEYVIVRDGEHGPTVVRRYGSNRTSAIPLAPGVGQPGQSFGSDPVWVENLSTRTVRVETTQYGRGLGFGGKPQVLPPNTSAHFVHIDHIGPSDPPPSQVKDEANIGISFREWLTWD